MNPFEQGEWADRTFVLAVQKTWKPIQPFNDTVQKEEWAVCNLFGSRAFHLFNGKPLGMFSREKSHLPNLNLALWILSLEMSHAPRNSIAMVGGSILILSNIHVVLHNMSLFSGNWYFMSGNHFKILGRQKATLNKVELRALYM